MSQYAEFTTFVAQVDVVEQNVQNAQELASVWGQIRGELDEIGVDVKASYAVLGDVDFVVVYEAPDMETAFKASLTVERHGMDVETLQATPTDHFAQLVEEI